jgi:hypothetical protein
MAKKRVSIEQKHYEELKKCEEIAGIPFADLLDEALEWYVECNASVLMKSAARDAGNASPCPFGQRSSVTALQHYWAVPVG